MPFIELSLHRVQFNVLVISPSDPSPSSQTSSCKSSLKAGYFVAHFPNKEAFSLKSATKSSHPIKATGSIQFLFTKHQGQSALLTIRRSS